MPLVRKNPTTPPPEMPADSAMLAAGDADARFAAARALARPDGLDALAGALRVETDARVRAAIFTSLVAIGGERAVDAVLPHLRSDDAGLRGGALDALSAMGPAVEERLEALLQDADPDVRILACELGRVLPAAHARTLLAGLLMRDPAVNVCAAAVEVLAEVGGREALPALAACAARFPQEVFLQFAITAVLERIGASDRE